MAKRTQEQKAKGIVTKALGTFTKAVEEIKKANVILDAEAKKDEQKLKGITKSIENKYKQIDAVQSEKLNKESEIIQNENLIEKLEQFTK